MSSHSALHAETGPASPVSTTPLGSAEDDEASAQRASAFETDFVALRTVEHKDCHLCLVFMGKSRHSGLWLFLSSQE